MSHTPGPWRVSSNCVLGSDNAIVATVATYSQVEFTKEEKSNAHLIAAAPDLLEACEAAKHIFEDSDNWNVQSFQRILAAIKKARGEA